MHLTLSLDAFLSEANVLEPKMQNSKDNLHHNPTQQDNRPDTGEQRHEGSAKIVGESFDVNENDVRDQDRPDPEAVERE